MRGAHGGCGAADSCHDRVGMQSPTRLRVFHEAEEMTVEVYRLTETLPTDERYGLCQQMPRATVSVVSNIAEGCGRDGNRELVRFLSIALGSASELEAQLRLSRRLAYLEVSECQTIEERVRRVQRMLTSLIVRLRPAPGDPEAGRKPTNRQPTNARALAPTPNTTPTRAPGSHAATVTTLSP